MLPVMVADAGTRTRQARPLPQLTGQKLEFVRLGHAIVLSFTGGRQVLIENTVLLNGPKGRHEVEPGTSSDILATLLGEVVRGAKVRANGDLEVCFTNGAEIRVGVDQDFESWAVTGPSGMLIVCLARGEIASWGTF